MENKTITISNIPLILIFEKEVKWKYGTNLYFKVFFKNKEKASIKVDSGIFGKNFEEEFLFNAFKENRNIKGLITREINKRFLEKKALKNII